MRRVGDQHLRRRRPGRSAWNARMISRPVISPQAPAGGCRVARAMPVISHSARSSRQSSSSMPCTVWSGCSGCSRWIAGERRDRLGDLRVVLHRARPERVGAGVDPVVLLRQPRVVAHEVDLGDLRQPGRAGPRVRRRHLDLRHVERRERERPTTAHRPIHDRAVGRRRALGPDRRAAAHRRAPPPWPRRRRRSRARIRRSVTATTSTSSPTPGIVDARQEPALDHGVDHLAAPAAAAGATNSLKNGAPGKARRHARERR